MSGTEKQSCHLSGEVRQILFENTETGFGVIVLETADGNRIKACGQLAGVYRGQSLELSGRFESHADFGEEFKAESMCPRPPVTVEGIKRFLSSAVPGIGPKTAAQIVDRFGKDTIEILQKYPRRICEIPRIGKKKAAEIARVWKETSGRREVMMFLQGLGITPAYCSRLLAAYGDNAAEIVRKNPYQLAEDVAGVGFLKADSIARSMGFAEDSLQRMTAAAVFSLNTMVGSGHVCADRQELERRAAALTGRSPEEAARGVDCALVRKLLICDENMIYTPRLFHAERHLPEKISRLNRFRPFAGQSLAGLTGSLSLAEEQLNAVESVARSPLVIITGGPGVGKTTVIGELVSRAKKAKLKLMLAAPTGRAAKRLSEASGMPAKTIHRLLMFDPGTGRFSCDRDNTLDCDLLIVDECSMLDIILADALFDAVAPGTSVVLVGDVDQLPSVGPGRVLADLIESRCFAVNFLTRVFRQASGSRIITNAHRVNRGMLPEKVVAPDGSSDFYWIEEDDPDAASELVRKMVCERIPLRFGMDAVDDVQVLSPMNRGNCGTTALNTMLAEQLNPGQESLQVGERIYHMGDKVMQTANNYDKNVYNGDFGRIININKSKQKLTVMFDGSRNVEYAADETSELTLAYSVTVHKSQGSEFPAVVLVLLNQHFVMLQRNLLYTAMTRARKLLVIVGGRRAVELAVRNTRQEPRTSLLLRRFARISGEKLL